MSAPLSASSELHAKYLRFRNGRLLDVNTWDSSRFRMAITRVNETAGPLEFGRAVTDGNTPGGCRPPQEGDRILGFTVNVTCDVLQPGEIGVPNLGFYPAGVAIKLTRYDHMEVVAPCDVEPGDSVNVEPGTGRIVEEGITVSGCAWITRAKKGEFGVIQIDTRRNSRS